RRLGHRRGAGKRLSEPERLHRRLQARVWNDAGTISAMIPWEHLDSAQIPDGGELRLMRRGAELSIMSGSTELMNSRLSGSERALATLAIERLAGRARPQVLIGGLGMGFTLR